MKFILWAETTKIGSRAEIDLDYTEAELQEYCGDDDPLTKEEMLDIVTENVMEGDDLSRVVTWGNRHP